jgi:hypothetical protein
MKLVGVGIAVGFAALGATGSFSCAPGVLPPCEDDNAEYPDCWSPSAGDGGANPGGSGGNAGSGGGGSGGGMAGGMGGMGGVAAGGGSGKTPTATSAVAPCTKFQTLGEADAWFKMRCGSGKGGCHQAMYRAVWGELESADIWKRLSNVDAVQSCKGSSKMIVPGADWKKSVLYIKTHEMMPKCPDGKEAGATIMPPPGMADYPALTAEEKTCIENFVKVAAGN